MILAKLFIQPKQKESDEDILSDEDLLHLFCIVEGSICNILMFIDDENTFKNNVEAAVGNLDANTAHEVAEGRHMFSFENGSPLRFLLGIGPAGNDLTAPKTTVKLDYAEERLASKHLNMSWYELLKEDNTGNHGNLFSHTFVPSFPKGLYVSQRQKPVRA